MSVRSRQVRRIGEAVLKTQNIPCSVPSCKKRSGYAAHWEQDVRGTPGPVRQMRRYCQHHAVLYAAKHGVGIRDMEAS